MTVIGDLELTEARYSTGLLTCASRPHTSDAIESVGGRELGGLSFGSLPAELPTYPFAVLQATVMFALFLFAE